MRSTKRSKRLFRERKMKMKLKCEENKSLYVKLENLRKYLFKELKVLILQKLAAMDFLKKCLLLNLGKELSSKSVKLNKTLNVKDKKTCVEKIKKPKICYLQLLKLKKQETKEKS